MYGRRTCVWTPTVELDSAMNQPDAALVSGMFKSREQNFLLVLAS